MSQKELADYLRTKPSTVSSWEQNVSSPNADMLFEMCELFKISVDEIYGIDEDRFDFQFLKVCDWIEEAGFEVLQDEKDIERNLCQINHFQHGTIITVEKQGLIDMVDNIIGMSEMIKEQFIVDRIKLLFLNSDEFINSKGIPAKSTNEIALPDIEPSLKRTRKKRDDTQK